MVNSCEGCYNEAQERNRDFNNAKIKAKNQALEEDKPKAICYDQVTGFFITDASTAIRERYQIRDIASNVREITT